MQVQINPREAEQVNGALPCWRHRPELTQADRRGNLQN